MSVSLYITYPSPALSVWLWQVDDLQDISVIWLTPSTVDSPRPLALARLPQSVGEDGEASSEDLWASIPLHHVSLLGVYMTAALTPSIRTNLPSSYTRFSPCGSSGHQHRQNPPSAYTRFSPGSSLVPPRRQNVPMRILGFYLEAL